MAEVGVRVSYGYPEVDPQREPQRSLYPVRDQDGTVIRFNEITIPRLRRRRFETWRVNGQLMGRWFWETY